MNNSGSALVVGGSIGGLTAAIALARSGIRTTVLECRETFEGRGGIGVDYRMLCEATGENPDETLAYIYGYRRSTSFNALYAWLAEVGSRVEWLDMRLGVDVTKVYQDDEKAYATTDSVELAADILIGADGYRSLVRSAVNPDRLLTDYAGFMTWRGWIAESALPAETPSPSDDLVTLGYGRQMLVAFPLPGLNNRDMAKGLRTIGFAWHDPTRTKLLEDVGCVADGKILRGLEMDMFPPGLKDEMIATTRRMWPTPWREAIVECFEQDLAFGTPIGNYLPERMSRGRIALIGDAAHAVAPATGQGYNSSVEDAIALRDCARDGVAGAAGPAAMAEFERRRLPAAQELVRWSRQWSRTYAGSH
ncbi:FAD-dependent monooxygenase [Nocardia sp. 2]|uniref:FAD-dependent monooxygenase n=1 Tax=Nocardia acididurans TaxID=2802282 RepID=A0ABS1M406_9NOCA|nr:FAD-dependent monooxygenase [Nocardia acididurans]MBL1075388.1 FAD-dependent monooxygenase [Nocardia acididurans]